MTFSFKLAPTLARTLLGITASILSVVNLHAQGHYYEDLLLSSLDRGDIEPKSRSVPHDGFKLGAGTAKEHTVISDSRGRPVIRLSGTEFKEGLVSHCDVLLNPTVRDKSDGKSYRLAAGQKIKFGAKTLQIAKNVGSSIKRGEKFYESSHRLETGPDGKQLSYADLLLSFSNDENISGLRCYSKTPGAEAPEVTLGEFARALGLEIGTAFVSNKVKYRAPTTRPLLIESPDSIRKKTKSVEGHI